MKAIQIMWIYYLCFVISAIWIESKILVHNRDIVDVQVGWTFVFRTWSYNGTTFIIKVKKENITRMDAIYDGYVFNVTEDQADRLVLQYQETSKEVYLSFRNISREDQGLYEIRESLYETVSDPFGRKDGKWIFQINVLGRDEIKRGNVGDNIIIIEFTKTSESIITLKLYDTIVAHVVENDCAITTKSQFYGRLICAIDGEKSNYRFEIKNVTQRDAGLYKVDIEGSETKKCFLNITDVSISAAIGDNLTLAWYYNQQGMNRTLRIIHPNHGVMMKLTPANVPKIRANFQHRILYSGEIVRSFMSFTLLNVEQSDGGVYYIETLHGNAIPGRKLLIVEDTSSKEGSTNNEASSLPFPNIGSRSESRTFSSRVNDEYVEASLAVIRYNQQITEPISPSVTSRSAEILNKSIHVPAYIIPVTIGALVAINLMVCILIRIRRKKARGLEAERHQVLQKCDADLYLTPIAAERPLPIPPSDDVRMDHSNTAHNCHVDTSTELFSMVHSPCMDGHEMIRISSNDDFQNTQHNNEVTAESIESSITPFLDASDYLTVEYVMESAVQNTQTA